MTIIKRSRKIEEGEVLPATCSRIHSRSIKIGSQDQDMILKMTKTKIRVRVYIYRYEKKKSGKSKRTSRKKDGQSSSLLT
jgi:hypothetical protein